MNSSLTICLACLLLFAAALPAQPLPQYELSIQNPVLSGSIYRFDVVVKRVGVTPFRLGNSQCILTFNAGNFLAPAITRLPASEQIGTGFFFDELLVGNEIRISIGGNGSFAAASDIATTGTRIATYELSGVNVPILSAGLLWVNPPALIRTGVSEINGADNYRDITSAPSHINGGGEFGSVSGYVFNDLNGNGAWDQPAEPALSGWTVTLNGPGGPFTAPSSLTGYVEFTNLTPGSYTISETIQSGWSQTLSPVNPLLVSSGSSLTNRNFGNFNGPAVGGLKFNDLNGNGVRDPLEPTLGGWEIVATKVIGGATKTQLTNGAGTYIFTFLPSESGLWTISETIQPGWFQTFPSSPSTYTLNVQSGSSFTGIDFGNQFRPSSIGGLVYNDLNGDSTHTLGEPGLAGVKMFLLKNSLYLDSTTTDGTGHYLFPNLVPASYLVSATLAAGSIHTQPAAPGTYTVIISSVGTDVTGKDFGDFRLGTISGTVYYDMNHSGSRDLGELGMAGVTMHATRGAATYSTTSLPGGTWTFTGLPAGNYTVAEQVTPGYHLTEPLSLTYPVTIASGSSVAGLVFGNSAAADTIAFRTMSYDSIAYSKDLKRKLGLPMKRIPNRVEFCNTFLNSTGRAIIGMEMNFGVAIITNDPSRPFVVTPPPSSVRFVSGNRGATILWPDSIPNGASVSLCGWGIKGKLQSFRFQWKVAVKKLWTPIVVPPGAVTFNQLRLPMPNFANVPDELFARNAFAPGGLVVGIPDVANQKTVGWVRITKMSDYYKSIIYRGLIHTTLVTGFDYFDRWLPTRERKYPFQGEHRSLRPYRQDNRLFADLLTLKTNIAASDFAITAPGLGDLVYDDGASSESGSTLRELVDHIDSAMTYWVDKTVDEYVAMDSVVRRINHAFEGPMDTVSFGSGLVLRGVRRLQEIPFLRANPGVATPVAKLPQRPRETLPEKLELFQNYPNPFNPVSTIQFDLPEEGIVSLTLYNAIGQQVMKLINNEVYDAGRGEVEIDGSNLASGVYIYRLVVQGTGDVPRRFMASKKLMLLK